MSALGKILGLSEEDERGAKEALQTLAKLAPKLGEFIDGLKEYQQKVDDTELRVKILFLAAVKQHPEDMKAIAAKLGVRIKE